MSLADSLGGLRLVPQWFTWRLVWLPEKSKFEKTPCTPLGPWIVDAAQPANWLTYEGALAQLEHMRKHGDERHRYALGFWMTADCGYWFLDIDKCWQDGQWTPIATQLVKQLAGCFFEMSSSGAGMHLIGRGAVPLHSMRNKEHALELYTEQRGIAFGLTGEAQGTADLDCTPVISWIAQQYFPPRDASEDGRWDGGPRADWSGPTDDDELLALAHRSESVAARMGHKATFSQLWYAAPVLDKFYGPDSASERDAALASHLAFWTGCDAPRIERLMRKSKLARAKWDEHRRYLHELTIVGACERQGDVYSDRKRTEAAIAEGYSFAPTVAPVALAAGIALGALPMLPALPALPGLLPPSPALAPIVAMVSPEAKAIIDALLDEVGRCSKWEDMHNVVIPLVRSAALPPMLLSRVENAINKRLGDVWDAKLPVAKLRALIQPPRVVGGADDGELSDVPEWARQHVYVKQGDRFHDLKQGVACSRTSFQAEHARKMPTKGDGPQREDPVMWALERWGMEVVHDVAYYPGMPTTFAMDGLMWANQYTEASHPLVTEYTAEGVAAINKFQQHVQILCGGRVDVYNMLMAFLAHNVQKPGVKIRWCPIIKGCTGDGKSIMGNVLHAAMGGRNVAFVGPETVANQGGFTDWAHGHAVAALEELHFAGKERHRIANAVKPFITNNLVGINPKGDKPKYVVNTCNQLAYTNFNDAVPIDDEEERRWFVIFTPFKSAAHMAGTMGLDELGLERHFDAIWDSLKREPGQWRRWLLEYPIDGAFSANKLRIRTAEKSSMVEAGRDDVENLAREVVEDGAHGVSRDVISSQCFSATLKLRSFAASVELPKSSSLHHLLNRMGFVNVGRVKWNNEAHRCWVKPGTLTDNDSVRALLNATIKK